MAHEFQEKLVFFIIYVTIMLNVANIFALAAHA